jgi:MinD-like ATPase involved in chromosome partitioning or flagellar assembly
LKPSAAERAVLERRARIRRKLAESCQIAVLSVKGGVGRTTVTAVLGSTYAQLRADRVVAVDANPDFGDLTLRVGRHPRGLTLRDLVRASSLDTFAAVQSFAVTNSDDLDIVASAWTSNANDVPTADQYAAAAGILRRHYGMLLADCGTGMLDSATMGVLRRSDAVVVVTPPTLGGVHGAVATMNWMLSHGLHRLVARSAVAIVHHQLSKARLNQTAVERVFSDAQRPTFTIPYDYHLAEGGEIDLRLLGDETRDAFEELAAALTDGVRG